MRSEFTFMFNIKNNKKETKQINALKIQLTSVNRYKLKQEKQ